MSSGGGKKKRNPFADVKGAFERWKNDPLGATADAFVSTLSTGAIRYKDGKVQGDRPFRNADEMLGEVTGRNAARHQINETEKRLNEAERQRQRDQANEWLRNQQMDIMASQSAQAARSSASARSAGASKGGARNKSLLGSEERDYLGL